VKALWADEGNGDGTRWFHGDGRDLEPGRFELSMIALYLFVLTRFLTGIHPRIKSEGMLRLKTLSSNPLKS
jgi:hypothetical protein